MTFPVSHTGRADYDLELILEWLLAREAGPHQVRVLFTVAGDSVVVLHIRHGRRRHLGEPQ